MQNKAIILTAPSGSGKTTIASYLLTKYQYLTFSVSATTRKKRNYEIDGEHYHFLSSANFQQKIANNDFLEWEEVYEGMFYGTLKSELHNIWQAGQIPVFDVDVKGALNLKKAFSNMANSMSIFIKPPSLEVLEQRLIKRQTETAENLAIRLKKVAYELQFAPQFDVCIVNQDLTMAESEVSQVVEAFIAAHE